MPCIKNCFRKCGFINEQFEPDKIIPVPVQATESLKQKGIISADFNYEDYVHCDSNLKVGAELSDKTIVQSTEEILGLASVLSDEEEEQEEPPLARVSIVLSERLHSSASSLLSNKELRHQLPTSKVNRY